MTQTARRLFPDTDQCAECGEPFNQPGLLTRCATHHVGGKLTPRPTIRKITNVDP